MTNTANITSRLRVIEGDFRSVDYASLGKFNVYLFDGPHAEEDQRDGIVCALPALAERFLLVVDDWNWLDVARHHAGLDQQSTEDRSCHRNQNRDGQLAPRDIRKPRDMGTTERLA